MSILTSLLSLTVTDELSVEYGGERRFPLLARWVRGDDERPGFDVSGRLGSDRETVNRFETRFTWYRYKRPCSFRSFSIVSSEHGVGGRSPRLARPARAGDE